VHYLNKIQNNIKKQIPVILITDGDPDDQDMTIETFKRLQRIIKIYGIGIKCNDTLMRKVFGENYVSIKDLIELKTKLIILSKKIVKNF
jgi:hypothetical protein